MKVVTWTTILVPFVTLFYGCASHKLLIESIPPGASVYSSPSPQGTWSRIPSSEEVTPCRITVLDTDDHLLKAKKYGYKDSNVIPIKDIIVIGGHVFELQELSNSKVYDDFYGKSITRIEIGQSSKKNIAIMNFSTKEDVGGEQSYYATEFIQDALVKTEAFNVVDRRNTDRVINEIKFQRLGLTDSEKAVEIGKMLNVEEIIVGNVGMLGHNYVISFSIIEIATGKVVYSDTAHYEKESDLGVVIVSLVNKLVQKRFSK